MLVKSEGLYKFTLVVLLIGFALLVNLYIASHAKIATDEYWFYSEAFLFAKGYIPYLDYFNHRLPLNNYIYGYYVNFISSNIVNIRYLSATFNIITLCILLIINQKINGLNLKPLIIIFLILFYPINLYLTNTISSYALTNLLISISLYIVINEKTRIYNGLIISLIYISRYILDYTVGLSLISSLIFYGKKFKKIIIYNIIFLFIPVLIYLKYGYQIIIDTFIFNIESFRVMVDHSVIPEIYLNKLNRFLLLRKLEIQEWWSNVIILLVTSFFLIKERNLNEVIRYNYLIIALNLIFYYTSVNDYPATKISLIIPIIVLYIYSYKYICEIKNLNNFLILILMISILRSGYSYIENEKIGEIKICEKLDCNSNVFSFNPILNTSFSKGEVGMSMELYGFASYKENDYKLMKFHDILINLSQKKYDYIIVDERFSSNINMSKIVNDYEKNNFFKLLNENYIFQEAYNEKVLNQKLEIWKKHDR